nr:DUF6443 domain-containing protein [uncultured Allomuricauda sp.]
MKKTLLCIIILGFAKSWSQTTSENYTKTYEPKSAFTITELDNLISDPTTPASIDLSNPVSSGTYEAKEQITLSNGFHATGNVSIKIVGFHEEVLETVTYSDGLGRSTQSIAKGHSPDGYDIVRFAEYDQYGRTEKTYLPYPTTQRTGNIIANPLSQQQSYYQTNYGDTYAYGQTISDDSPLNRTIEVSSPGYDWRIITGSDNDHTVKREYDTNISTLEIVKFTVDDSGSTPIVNKGAYVTKELFKNIVKNENWQTSDGQLNTIEAYTDKNGRTIARVVFKEVSGTVEKRVTQNVYDKQGRLRYILPPKALVSVTTSSGTYTIDDDLVYQYQYDDYNRQIAQRGPGRDWEYLVYDQLDRPILTQDANLDANNEWLFTKYDVFGRPIYSGIYSSTKSRDQLQTDVDNYINGNTNNKSNVETSTTGTTSVGGIAMNYTNDAFPTGSISEVLSVNYYDDYSFTDADKPTTPTSIQGQTVTTRTQGLQTANFTKTLGQSTWTKLYSYYDEKGREIKIYNRNHLGGYTTTESELDFRGKTDLAITKHKRTNAATELTIEDRFTYDYAERSLGHFQKIDGQAEERISENEYDEMGMLIKKKVGGNSSSTLPLQELNYTYNIRGQFKSLNDIDNPGNDLFSFKINYNDPTSGFYNMPSSITDHNVDPQYNGNIAQTIWRENDDYIKSYKYNYDELNRLISSKYQFSREPTTYSYGGLNTNITYDENGNVRTLVRKLSSVEADGLTYSYGSSGNQLLYVTDTNSNPSAGFFKDLNTSGNDYDYDANGNMTKDLNKGITNIAYNHLDLVNTVSLPSNKSVTFLYDASGAKLQKKYLNGSTTVTATDYLGGFQYTDGNLQFIPTPEGYIYYNGGSYKHMYVYTDHLGNNRVSYTDTNGNGSIESGELASKRSYYPFGLQHAGAFQYQDGLAAVYKYTFQGKEYQDEDGLDWHDFGSRMYDSQLGRWMATDPQNQFGSPYLAMGNNPIVMLDPDGEWVHILAGALIGGTINLISNWDNIDNFWEGAAAFGSGALVGGATALCGACGSATLIAAGGGALLGATNNVIAQTGNGVGLTDVQWDQVGLNATVGAISGVAARGASQWATKNLSSPLINELGIKSPAIADGINGMVGGSAGGIAGGFTSGYALSGGNLDVALQGAKTGATTGAIIGLGSGLGTGYYNAKKNNINPWSGKSLSSNEKGDLGVKLALKDLKKIGAKILGRSPAKYTLNERSGYTDLLAEIDGEIVMVEVKYGESYNSTSNPGKINPNQRINYSRINDGALPSLQGPNGVNALNSTTVPAANPFKVIVIYYPYAGAAPIIYSPWR